jgi:hypothetical protein
MRVETFRNLSKFKLNRNSTNFAQVKLFSSSNLRRGRAGRCQVTSLVGKGLKVEPLKFIEKSFIERKSQQQRRVELQQLLDQMQYLT